jgi:hypothetical protein
MLSAGPRHTRALSAAKETGPTDPSREDADTDAETREMYAALMIGGKQVSLPEPPSEKAKTQVRTGVDIESIDTDVFKDDPNFLELDPNIQEVRAVGGREIRGMETKLLQEKRNKRLQLLQGQRRRGEKSLVLFRRTSEGFN